MALAAEKDKKRATQSRWALLSSTSSFHEPQSEAIIGPDALHWQAAISAELQNMARMQAWKLVPLPHDRTTVGCRWVFKINPTFDGQIHKYKAWLVAKGFTQIPDIDYEETFSPIVKLQSFRILNPILIAIAAYYKLDLHQLDVIAAFLKQQIFIAISQGLSVCDRSLVCLLERSIYGLKQSAPMRYERFHFALLNIGFISITADSNIYILLDNYNQTYDWLDY